MDISACVNAVQQTVGQMPASLPYPDFDPVIFHIGKHIAVRWYGLMYVLAFAFGIFLVNRMVKEGLAPLGRKSVDIYLVPVMVAVIVGARLGIFVFYEPGTLFTDPLAVFRIWQGGMSFHGAIVGLVIAIALISRKHGVHFYTAAEQAVVAGVPGLAFGRFGNFINGELYGRVTNVPWGVRFPVYEVKRLMERGYTSVLEKVSAGGGEASYRSLDLRGLLLRTGDSGAYQTIHQYLYSAPGQLIQPLARHPSQLYEMLIEGVILGTTLWLLRRWIRRPGRLTAIFLAGYGTGRFLVEFFRTPTPAWGFSIESQKYFTMGQALCLLMVIAGIAVWLHSRKLPEISDRLPAFGGSYPETT